MADDAEEIRPLIAIVLKPLGYDVLLDLTRSQSTDLPLRLRGTVSCHNDDRLLTVHTADLFQDFDPTHPRHIHIKHNDIGVFPAIQFKPRPPIISKEHIIAQRLKNYRDERSDVFRIVNDQNLGQDVPAGWLCGIWLREPRRKTKARSLSEP